MYFNVYDVFYSLNSHQRFSAMIPSIFNVMSLLQQYRHTNVFNPVTITP